jgi:hypothetical protein
MSFVKSISEQVARRTTRRGLFGRGADVVFGAVAGAAAGTISRAGKALGTDRPTHCAFPGPPCPCDECLPNGVCAKPCVILTTYYASGCWVTTPSGKDPITCCDCNCPDVGFGGDCGCGSDYHNNPQFCPN